MMQRSILRAAVAALAIAGGAEMILLDEPAPPEAT